jgi:hypothetical protein
MIIREINSGSHSVGVGSEIFLLALPAVVGQAIDPLAQLMETAYIGRLGTSFVLLCHIFCHGAKLHVHCLSWITISNLFVHGKVGFKLI